MNMSDHPSDHLATYASETFVSDQDALWGTWTNRVQDILSLPDLDGDFREDGYSMDTFVDMFEFGLTSEVAATRIRGALFVDFDGNAYRLSEAGDNLSGEYTEHYKVFLAGGMSTSVYGPAPLPDDARLVWCPIRGHIGASA